MIPPQILLSLFLSVGLAAPSRAADIPSKIKAPAKRVAPIITNAAALPVAIAATNPSIHYGGRFDTSKGNPRCAWSGCTIVLKFKGTDLNAKLEDQQGRNV